MKALYLQKVKPKVMLSLIESNPEIMKGQPVISGTRITVKSILERLSAGESHSQILEAHPHLTEESISAALAFAASALKADVIYPIAS